MKPLRQKGYDKVSNFMAIQRSVKNSYYHPNFNKENFFLDIFGPN